MVNILIHIALVMANLGCTIGLIVGGLLLLRPVVTRLITPQQRTILWLVAWMPAYMPTWYQITNWVSVLPVTFRSLVVPRSGAQWDIPAFLPAFYDGPGAYHIALPGGAMVQVGLNDYILLTLTLVWLVGVVGLGWHMWKKDRALMALAWEGELLSKYDPLIQDIPGLYRDEVVVRLCENLPTSFVRLGNESMEVKCKYAIYLQAQLPRQQLRLVLLHEAQHIQLLHCYFKGYANFGLALFWWNPLVWLGYRYFCRDMELACDKAALKQLEAGQRKEYAKTLVELGAGRQLWDVPLSFGECDAALRVQAAVAFRPRGRWSWREPVAIAGTLLLMLFFIGGPQELYRQEDMALTIARGAGGVPGFVQTIEQQLDIMPGSQGGQVEQLWCGLNRDIRSRPYSSQGPEGYVMARTQDGRWYQMYWYERAGDRVPAPYSLDQPPDLSGFVQIL